MRWTIRALLALFGAYAVSTGATEPARIVGKIDHLVFAVADLNDGVKQIEAATGVRAQFGGPHPGRGTHNALLSLGPRVYLELIAPDPAQANPTSLQSLGLSQTRSSRLVAWAVSSPDIERFVRNAGAKGLKLAAPDSGERKRPDGKLLAWRTTQLADDRTGHELAPFFIDWGAAEHPAVTSPKGVRLLDLRAEHPSPESLRSLLSALEAPLTVESGSELALIAVLDTPRGRVELR